MHFDSKKVTTLLLGITAITCARVMFVFFNDPEGPNLLVIAGMAAIIFSLSLAVHKSRLVPSLTGFKRTLATVVIQILITTLFYLALK